MPKVTMLCKWPLIYVWILAVPLFCIHWNIGCSGWRSLYRQEYFIWDTSLFCVERHQQLAVVLCHSLNQIRKTMNFPQFPTLFAKLNLPQHRLALRSINKSKGILHWSKGFSGPSRTDVWGYKQRNGLSVGAAPRSKAVLYSKFKAVYYK